MKSEKSITIMFILMVAMFLFIVIGVTYMASHSPEPKIKIVNKDISHYYKYNITYQQLSDFCDSIKSYEGLELKPYEFNKHYYIGYGHLITASIASIDTTVANVILICDVETCIEEAYKLTKLTGNKLLCVTDFLFNYGSPKFIRSTLYSLFKYHIKDTLKIHTELLSWNYINGYPSKRLYSRRCWDWKLFTNNTLLIILEDE